MLDAAWVGAAWALLAAVAAVALVSGRFAPRPHAALLVVAGAAAAAAAALSLRGAGHGACAAACVALLAAAAALALVARLAAPEHGRQGPAPQRGAAEADFDRLIALVEVVRLVSHAVRNSLSVVVSGASMLERDRPEGQRRELLRAMAEEGERMRLLVDELAAVAGDGPLARERLDGAALLADAAARAARHGDWKGSARCVIEAPRGKATFAGDRARLEAALSHLILCAATGGASVVTLRAESHGEGGTRLVIAADAGPPPEGFLGPAEAELAPDRLHDACWLWLAIARRLARAHGGRLETGGDVSRAFAVTLDLPPSG